MEAKPHTTASVIAFVARKPGTSFEEFKSYYEDRHIPWVISLILTGDNQPVSYTRHYVDRDDAASLPYHGDEFKHDCMTEIVFRDVQARDAALQAFAKHQEEITADENKFLDRSASRIIFATESVSSVAK